MAGIGDFLKSDLAKGLAIGIGVAVTVPIAMVILTGAGRPIARALARSGKLLYEKGSEAVAEVGEVIEDMVAEAKVEMRQTEGHTYTASKEESGSEAGQDSPNPDH